MTQRTRVVRAALLATLLLGLFHTLALAADGTATFALRPAHPDPARPATQDYFIHEATPGQSFDDAVVVRNTGTTAGTVRLFPVDAITGQHSGAVYLGEADPQRKVGAWIQVERQELTLQPGEEQTVSLTVSVPADAPPGQHLGGVVALNTAVRSGNGGGGIQINTQARMVTAVQIEVPGARSEHLTIIGLDTIGQVGGQNIVLDLRNDGTQMLKPTGSLTITDASGGEVVRRLDLVLDTFLPRTAIQYPAAITGRALAAGRYHAKVDLAYGANGVATYEGDFSVTTEQLAQVFPAQSAAPVLAPPTTEGRAAATPTDGIRGVQWPLFAGGAVLLVLVLVGGIFLGRRGRSTDAAK